MVRRETTDVANNTIRSETNDYRRPTPQIVAGTILISIYKQ